MSRIFGALLFLLVVIASCNEDEKKANSSINGVWQSIGSGWILEVLDSTTYDFYDVTSISCNLSRQGSIEEIQASIQLKNDTLALQKGVITYFFSRSKELPNLCQNEMDKNRAENPIYNFEVFAETIKEHYAFFQLNNINWDDLYKRQRLKITSTSADTELYLVMEETLEALNDNHAYLEASEDVYDKLESLEIPETETENGLPEYGDFQVAKMVAQHHMVEELTKDSWLIQWGRMENKIGFIQVKSMWLYGDLDIPQTLIDEQGLVNAYVETFHKMYEGDYIRKEIEGVKDIMDRVMSDLDRSEAIVIDVRFNGGGQDAVSFEILSRFLTEDTQVATQKLRHGNQFSPLLHLSVEGRPDAFTGPIYILTSPQTGSAAEAFSIATMAMDNAHRIGSRTTGAMSTALEKKLPNGWTFSISNEVYMDNNGQNYENVGVPVDYELNYPRDRQEFFRSIVNGLETDKLSIVKAIEELELQDDKE